MKKTVRHSKAASKDRLPLWLPLTKCLTKCISYSLMHFWVLIEKKEYRTKTKQNTILKKTQTLKNKKTKQAKENYLPKTTVTTTKKTKQKTLTEQNKTSQLGQLAWIFTDLDGSCGNHRSVNTVNSLCWKELGLPSRCMKSLCSKHQ